MTFTPGHQHGLATRFKQGVCPNPAGRPAKRPIRDAIRKLMNSAARDRDGNEIEGMTNADVLALDLRTPSDDPAVIYLSHDEDSKIIAPTFTSFLREWSRLYCVGPEFWMIEPEVAFYELEDNMDLAEDFLQYLVKYALDNCKDDLEFLDKRFAEEEKQKPTNERSELGLLDKLTFVVENKFHRLTYTEAVEILKNAKKKFQFPVDWGTDLQSEHERYLVEKHFKKPVILTDYPEHIKAFYMKLSEDGKTVRAMDVLFPGIGEIIGGSQREENYDKLKKRAEQFGIEQESIWWYLETREFGACPHAGFGLGFERLVLFVTGMSNIRDVIPFPRYPKSAEF